MNQERKKKWEYLFERNFLLWTFELIIRFGSRKWKRRCRTGSFSWTENDGGDGGGIHATVAVFRNGSLSSASPTEWDTTEQRDTVQITNDLSDFFLSLRPFGWGNFDYRHRIWITLKVRMAQNELKKENERVKVIIISVKCEWEREREWRGSERNYLYAWPLFKSTQETRKCSLPLHTCHSHCV